MPVMFNTKGEFKFISHAEELKPKDEILSGVLYDEVKRAERKNNIIKLKKKKHANDILIGNDTTKGRLFWGNEIIMKVE